MKFRLTTILFALVVGVLGAQDQTEPEKYPGQHDHAKPPEGWYCSPQTPKYTIPPDHLCACQRHTIPNLSTGEECIKNPDGTDYLVEDPKCSVWCHADHCRCPHDSCDT